MDTIGSAIDKLITVDMKLWTRQDQLYAVRRMNFEEFLSEFSTREGMEKLYEVFKAATDLNVQRSHLVAEVDTLIVKLIQSALDGKNLDDGKNIQLQHKNY